MTLFDPRTEDTRPACSFHDGAIWWRGSNPGETYKSRDDAVRLRNWFAHTLAEDWFKPTADRFVADIDAAIQAYDEWEESLVAA